MTTYYPTKLQAVLHAEEASQNDAVYHVITTGDGGYYSTQASELEVTDRILYTYKNGLRVKAVETTLATFEREGAYSPSVKLIALNGDCRQAGQYQVEYAGRTYEFDTEEEAKVFMAKLITKLLTEEL